MGVPRTRNEQRYCRWLGAEHQDSGVFMPDLPLIRRVNIERGNCTHVSATIKVHSMWLLLKSRLALLLRPVGPRGWRLRAVWRAEWDSAAGSAAMKGHHHPPINSPGETPQAGLALPGINRRHAGCFLRHGSSSEGIRVRKTPSSLVVLR